MESPDKELENWLKFIEKTAKLKIPNATYHETFINVFGKFKDVGIRGNISKSEESHLTKIYQCFEQECQNYISKGTKREILRGYLQALYTREEVGTESNSDRPPSTPTPQNIPTPETLPELTTLEFIGRDRDLTNLASLRNQYKIVLIKAGAGVGKSTLAREFLQTNFKKVIRIEMGLESGNVTPAEEKVSQILRKDFDEEPSRDFGINLDILREKLGDRTNPIGVLIDNLEPALDENYRFREKLRGYDALLSVLGDRDVFSFTLITSRRSLITPRAKVNEYSLEGLDITAWRQYFHDCENVETSDSLLQMRDAYNGNAKVMDILHGAIKNRFDGNIGAYWNRYKDALLADPELETLISVEMDWLRDNQPDAYKLLCRMGCYRYQDVKTVPFEGLICLLWDVPESRQVWVVDYLSKTSLIEVKEEYYLHPAVREIAKLQLIKNKINWKNANQKAAQFYQNKISYVKTVQDVLAGFEIIYHYLEANEYQKSASVIFELQTEHEDAFDNFGFLCWRFGFSQPIIKVISKILQSNHQIKNEYYLAGIYRILGYAENQLGNINQAIQYHNLSGDITRKYFHRVSFKKDDQDHLSMRGMLCAYFVNTGLCYLDLWDLGKALDYFQRGISEAMNFEINRYWVEDHSLLSLIKSYFGLFEEAEKLAEEAYDKYQFSNMSAWGRTYTPLILGKTYKNVGNRARSLNLYQLALDLSDKNNYIQAKANAMVCLAEYHKESQDFNVAYSYHLESINILQNLEAKCDLAEAYFQFGLTYQAMGEHDQAKEYKEKALELFAQMEAPKQIERVNKAFEQGAVK